MLAPGGREERGAHPQSATASQPFLSKERLRDGFLNIAAATSRLLSNKASEETASEVRGLRAKAVQRLMYLDNRPFSEDQLLALQAELSHYTQEFHRLSTSPSSANNAQSSSSSSPSSDMRGGQDCKTPNKATGGGAFSSPIAGGGDRSPPSAPAVVTPEPPSLESEQARRASTGSSGWGAKSNESKPSVYPKLSTLKQAYEEERRRASWPPTAPHVPDDIPTVAEGQHVLDRVKAFQEHNPAGVVAGVVSEPHHADDVPEHQHVADLVKALQHHHIHDDEQQHQHHHHEQEDMPAMPKGQHVLDRVKAFEVGHPQQVAATRCPPPLATTTTTTQEQRQAFSLAAANTPLSPTACSKRRWEGHKVATVDKKKEENGEGARKVVTFIQPEEEDETMEAPCEKVEGEADVEKEKKEGEEDSTPLSTFGRWSWYSASVVNAAKGWASSGVVVTTALGTGLVVAAIVASKRRRLS